MLLALYARIFKRTWKMRKKRAFPKEFVDPFSAPQALQISSLEALESSRRALSNGSKLDIRSSRGAEYRSINYLRKPEKSQILSNFSKLFPSVLGTTEFCIEFDQNFKFFDRPKTGALYFCHMVILAPGFHRWKSRYEFQLHRVFSTVEAFSG